MSKAQNFIKIIEQQYSPGYYPQRRPGPSPNAIGRKEELIKRVKSMIVQVERYLRPGRYIVEIDVSNGDAFIDVRFYKPMEMYEENILLQKFLKDVASRLFPRSRVIVDVDRVRNIYLRGFNISIDPIPTEDFTTKFAGEIIKRHIHKPGSRYIPPSR